jgi:hypothetical protein
MDDTPPEVPVSTQQPRSIDWRKQFMTVTPLSKALALVLFVLLPVGGFILGLQWFRTNGVIPEVSPAPVLDAPDTAVAERENEVTSASSSRTIYADPGGRYSLIVPDHMVAMTSLSDKNTAVLQDVKWANNPTPPLDGAPLIYISFSPNPDHLPMQQFYDGTNAPAYNDGNRVGSLSVDGIKSYKYQPLESMAGQIIVIVPLSDGFLEVLDEGEGYQTNGVFDKLLQSLHISVR